jgi:hypothetical protein
MLSDPTRAPTRKNFALYGELHGEDPHGEDLHGE